MWFILPILAFSLFNNNQKIEVHPSVNSSASLIARISSAELACSVEKSYYEIGDTIKIEISLRSVGDTSLMVLDPAFSSPSAIVNYERRFITVDLGGNQDGNYFLASKMTKLNPGDSIEYSANVVIDSIAKTEKYRCFEIYFSVRAWIFTDELSYLTEMDRSSGFFKKRDHIFPFNLNARTFRPGVIYIDVFKDLKNVVTDY